VPPGAEGEAPIWGLQLFINFSFHLDVSFRQDFKIFMFKMSID